MAKKSEHKSIAESPIQSKRQQLELQAEKLKAEIREHQAFQKNAPILKDRAQKQQQQELMTRFSSRTPVEGPIGFQFEFVRAKESKAPKKLRKERSKTPLITFVLFVTFVVVAYFAWKSLWQG